MNNYQRLFLGALICSFLLLGGCGERVVIQTELVAVEIPEELTERMVPETPPNLVGLEPDKAYAATVSYTSYLLTLTGKLNKRLDEIYLNSCRKANEINEKERECKR